MANTVILAETTYACLDLDTTFGVYTPGFVSPADFVLVAGETYSVIWNGETFPCTAFAWEYGGMTMVSVGDGTTLGVASNNEPFLLNYNAAYDNTQVFALTQGNHSVAIYQTTEESGGEDDSGEEESEEETPDKEYLIWGSTLKGIADAIRAKNGAAGEIAVTEMATKISAITGGGSSDVEVVYVSFMSHDGATELYRRAVVPGNSCVDVVSFGLLNTPTRESTAANHFTFAGWSPTIGGSADASVLDDVTANRSVYASYTASTRYYTVRFFDGATLLNTMQVAYGAAANYTPTKEGYQFEGWSPSNTNITADTDCYAQWTTVLTFANATWAQIAEISEAGEAASYFSVGDTKQIAYGDDVITVAIAGFDHDDLSDGSGKAGISCVCMTVPNYKTPWCSIYNSGRAYTYSSQYTAVRTVLNGDIWNTLPAELQSVIKSVDKKSDTSISNSASPTLTTTSEKLWLLSLDELGQSSSAEYYAPGTIYTSVLGNKYDLFTTADLSKSTSIVLPLPTVGSSSTYATYWTRTLNRTGMNVVYYIKSGSYPDYSQISSVGTDSLASLSYYLRFGFCV